MELAFKSQKVQLRFRGLGLAIDRSVVGRFEVAKINSSIIQIGSLR